MQLPREGWVALAGFVGTSAVGATLFLRHIYAESVHSLLTHGTVVVGAAALLTYVRKRNSCRHSSFWPAVGLGTAFGIGAVYATHNETHRNWGLYVCSLSFFHWSEYMTTALFNSHKLSSDSFLLNHSREYGLAAGFSWAEYWIESLLVPNAVCKTWRTAVTTGLALVIMGEFVRKTAMFTSRHNFSHIIATEKEDSHELVTHGIYRVSRHPSYMGWFWWSVGTQILLCNPLSTIAYGFASWKFFSERIQFEEHTLLNFFGPEYDRYKQNVGTGIPFIHGPIVSESSRLWWQDHWNTVLETRKSLAQNNK